MRLLRRKLAYLTAALALIAAVGAILALPAGTRAQGTLTLSDFDTAGLETDVLALIATGASTSTLFRQQPRGAAIGTLVDGELGLGSDDVAITEIRIEDSGAVLTINDSVGPFGLSGYFTSGGAGADLTLRVQTATASGSGTLNISRVGGGFAVFNMDSAAATLLDGLGSGERFIIALTRPSPEPAQVTGVAAGTVSTTTIAVSWTAVANADGYLVQWKSGAQDFGGGRESTTSGTSHTITGLNPETEYSIQVIATRTGAGNGPPSTPAVTARTLAIPPAQVTGVAAGTVSTTTIAVNWTAVANADGYLVQWKSGAQDFGGGRESTTSGTSHTITGLSPETEYSIQVIATRTGAGNGPPSTPAVTARTLAIPPAQVTGVAAGMVSTTTIAVSWTAVANADGYLVQWKSGAQDFGGGRESTTSGTSHTITGLSPETEYSIQVIATRTGVANGLPSTPAVTARTLAIPPGQVTGVAAAVVSHDTITVSWTELAEATGYVVRWDTDPNFANPDEAAAAATGYQVTGLREDMEYHVQVRATKLGASNGEWSQTAAPARTALQPPAQVAGLTGQAVSDKEIVLSWSSAARASGYIVQWRKTSESFNDQRQATTAQLSYHLTRLDPRTTYFFAVTSTRAGASNGPPSSSRFATTNPPQRPAQVTGLSATAISDREIQATWGAATNAEAYIVQWRADGDSFASDRQAEITGTQVVLEQLKAETQYFVRVAGTRRSAANGPWSAEDSAMTPIAGFTRAILRFPGGNPVAAQLSLVAFAGVFSGIKFRSHKSPKRESLILGFMCAASLILPILGIGSIFWTGGIVILVGLAAACVFFLKGRV